MAGTPRRLLPQICPTSLDPPESTLHPRHGTSRILIPRFPLAKSTGDFRLVGEVDRPAPVAPAMDPLDPNMPLKEVSERAHRTSNAAAGIRFRHATWAGNRSRVLEALVQDDPDPLAWIQFRDDPTLPDIDSPPPPTSRARRFAVCGTRAIVLQCVTDPSRFKVGCERCHDRFCLPCMQDRARLIVANLKAQLHYEPTRFITLTMKHNDDPLADQLDRLYTSFTCLRRRQFWQDTVTGGVAFLELKLSTADDRWHPHLHVLARGKYIPQKLIADAWLQITGDSHIVDVRMAKSPEHLYSYLTRYVTKAWDAGIYRKIHRLREAISALSGRKLLSSFGNFAALCLLKPPTSETWVELGTLQEVITLAARRIAWAVTACTAIYSASFEPPVCVEPPDQ